VSPWCGGDKEANVANVHESIRLAVQKQASGSTLLVEDNADLD